MATETNLKQLEKWVTQLLAFNRDRLIKRNEWGTITFEKGAKDFQRIFDIADSLQTLPVDVLSEQTVTQIWHAMEQCHSHIKQVDQFNLESTGNPGPTRDQYLQNLQSAADNLFACASLWIPYLAYQKGDVSKNISNLNSAVSKAALMIGEAQKEIAEKRKDIDAIVTQAREASAAAGAAVFTEDFSRQASNLERQASRWLIATAACGMVTLAASAAFFLLIKSGTESLEVLQRITSKVVILGVLLTATIWCGRIYKALMHQSSVYRFKALGLQTFQAFSAGASDASTKDAVLMETTRAIFSAQDSGYIDQSGSADSDTRIVEVVKSALPQSNA